MLKNTVYGQLRAYLYGFLINLHLRNHLQDFRQLEASPNEEQENLPEPKPH
jgi:hypothetical protein